MRPASEDKLTRRRVGARPDWVNTPGGRDAVMSKHRYRKRARRVELKIVSMMICQPVRGPSIDPQHGTQMCTTCVWTARIRPACARRRPDRFDPSATMLARQRRGSD